MNPRQKVLLTQLQIAGAGIILLVFGLFKNRTPIWILGLCVIVLGLARWFVFSKMVKDEPVDPELEEEFWKKEEEDEEESSDWPFWK
jgi:hypothetical protein